MSLARIVAEHRVLICVGTGGVGKTTVAAALALGGALAGRRAMVLTIDPARQLARALGLATLRRGGEPVPAAALASAGLFPAGSLNAGMLDQKAAWDAFISRHAPSTEVRDRLLENPFYDRLSTSFAGSTEFMAIEELCRLDESGEHDLIIIDTPPTGHAIDFVRAPDRMESLLDPQVARWVTRSYRALGPSGPLQAMSGLVRFAFNLVVRAFGRAAFEEVAAFFVALDALFSDISARVDRARGLLKSERTAFVLVAGPTPRTLAGSRELSRTMRDLGMPIRGVVINRVHPMPSEVREPAIERALAELAADAETSAWLHHTWRAATARAAGESDRLRAFVAELPRGTSWTEVPELEHDAHSLGDLAVLTALLLR